MSNSENTNTLHHSSYNSLIRANSGLYLKRFSILVVSLFFLSFSGFAQIVHAETYTFPNAWQYNSTPTNTNSYTDTDGSFTLRWIWYIADAYGDTSTLYHYLNGSLIQTYETGGVRSKSFSSLGAGNHRFKVLICYEIDDGEDIYDECTYSYYYLEITVPSAPSTPSMNMATTNNSGSYNISWDGVAYATSYKWQERLISETYGTEVFTASGTSVPRSGKGNGIWYYHVQACNATGCSGYSSERSVTVAITPGVPSSILASPNPSTGDVTVSWGSASGEISKYDFDYKKSTTGTWTNGYDGTDLSKALPGLSVGTWNYQVRACKTVSSLTSCSGWRTGSSTVMSVPTPSTPEVIGATNNTTGNYYFQWWGDSDIQSDNEQLQQQINGGSFTDMTAVIEDDGPDSMYTVNFSNKSSGVYGYRFKLCNQIGCGYSSVVNVYVARTPGVPSSLSVSPNPAGAGSTITVSWGTANGAITKYDLDYKLSSDINWTNAYDGTGTSKAVSGLNAGTYNFQVRACYTAGSFTNCSAYQSALSSLVNAPSSYPATFTVPSSNTSGSYSISWSAVSSATYYTWQEQIDGSWGSEQTTSLTSQGFSGKTANTYGYHVKACNVAGCGPYTTTKTTNVYVPTPSNPSIIGDVNNIDGNYRIEWYGNDDDILLQSIDGGNYIDTSYTAEDDGPDSYNYINFSNRDSGVYSYRIRICNIVGCADSAETTVYVARTPEAPPSTAVVPNVSADTEEQIVNWTASSSTDISEYQLNYDSTATGSVDVTGLGLSTSYTTPATLPADEYTFTAKACYTAGPFTNCSAGTSTTATRKTAPDTPSNFMLPETDRNGIYTIMWDSEDIAARYVLEEQPEGGAWAVIQDSIATSYVVQNQTSGIMSYRVKACLEEDICSDYTFPLDIEIAIAPDAPAYLNVTPLLGDGTLHEVDWGEANGDVEYYTLQRQYNDAPLPWDTLKTVIDDGSPNLSAQFVYSESNLDAGGYRYSVMACTETGSYSSCATRGTAVLVAAPDAPQVTTPPYHNIADGAYTVNWDPIDNITYYEAQERINDSWTPLTLSSSTATSYVATHTEGDYAYQVSACNRIGCTPSEIVTTHVAGQLETPGNIQGPDTALTGNYILSWAPPANASVVTQYRLQQRFNEGGWSEVYYGPASAYLAQVVDEGNYDYQVQACNADDCSGFTPIKRVVVSDEEMIEPDTEAYNEDFNSYIAGQNPTDWLDTGADNSLVEADLFQVMDLNGNMTFGTASDLSNIHSHYIGGNLAGLATGYEYTGRLQVNSDDSGIGVTFFSQYPTADQYYRLRREANGTFHIAPHGTGVGGDIESNVNPTANSWYFFKVQVEDTGTQTTIRVRLWLQGDAEPANWQIEAYDDSATRLITGTIGLWSTGSGNKYWDNLSVMALDTSNIAPEVTITSPADSGIYTEGELVTLMATATDAEDGDISGNVSWTSSLDGALGTGANISPSLSPGSHTLTASITDSADATASTSISVTVQSALDDDNDGVNNAVDQCPNTPAGDSVDANGCTVPPTGSAGVILFSDDFNRADGDVLGNGWIEKVAGAFELINGEVYKNATSTDDWQNLVHRPASEDSLDVEAAVEFRWIGDSYPGYPEVYVRVLADTIESQNYGELDGYFLHLNDSATGGATLARQTSTEGYDPLTTVSLTEVLTQDTRYRMRLSAEGTTAVELNVVIERWDTTSNAWIELGNQNYTDTASNRIDTAGSVGFSGYIEGDRYVFDNFTLTALNAGSGQPAVADDDVDGVNNVADQCPNTPAGNSVDANGCSISTNTHVTLWSQDFSSSADGFTQLLDSMVLDAEQLRVTASGDVNETTFGARSYAFGDGITFRYEITPIQTTNAGIYIGIRSSDDARGHHIKIDYSQLRVTYTDANGNWSTEVLGSVSNNTTYVLEIVTHSGGSTLYFYEKGSNRNSGYRHDSSTTDYIDVQTFLSIYSYSGWGTSIVTLDNLAELQALTTVVDFDNPEPSGGGSLNGVFEGIDFGFGQWTWSGAYGANSTNHIYFNSDVGTSRSFSFDVESRVLQSVTVYVTTNGTLTLSDNQGQSYTQALTVAAGLQTLNTGWTQAADIITVDYTSGWSLGLDDIVYSPATAPPVSDDDGDGVANAIDQCPNTPTGETVDVDGCSASQVNDDDGDGVANAIDLCPNTAGGDSVDANGCSTTQLGIGTPGPIQGPDTNQTGEFFLTWTAPTGTGIQYQLEQRFNNGAWSQVYYGPDLIYQASVYQNGNYDYQVRACNADACSDYTAAKRVFVYGAFAGSIETPPQPQLAAIPTEPAGIDQARAIPGEFDVNSSGQAGYTVPILTAPGTAGMVPQVSLSYSSGAGNGIAGMGWSLNGSGGISRCRQTWGQDRNAMPITWTSEDRFCLNGERLLVTQGEYGAPGSIYATEIESFARITAVGGTLGHPDYFTVEYKNGVIEHYGDNTQSSESKHQLDSANPNTVLTWSLSSKRDSMDNQIIYNYVNDPEGHRLDTIDYAFGSNSNPRGAYIKFNYGPRNDPLSGYVAGYPTRTGKKLESIYSYNNDIEIRRYNLTYNQGSAASTTDSISRINRIEECVGSVCAQPTDFEWALPENNFATSETNFALTNGVGINGSGGAPLGFGDFNGDGIQDIAWTDNNSHLRYALGVINTNDEVSFQTATFADNTVEALTDLDSDDWITRVEALDFNADGRSDLLVAGNRWDVGGVFLSQPQTDGSWKLVQIDSSAYKETNGALVRDKNYSVVHADVNGDGLVDEISWLFDDVGSGDYGAQIYHGSGKGWVRYLQASDDPTVPKTSSQYYAFSELYPIAQSYSVQCEYGPGSDCRYGGDTEHVVVNLKSISSDYNGDGRVDLVAAGLYRAVCAYENGEGEEYCTFDTATYPYLLMPDESAGKGALKVVQYGGEPDIHYGGTTSRFSTQLPDFNGDGLSDIVFGGGASEIWQYALNTGAGYEDIQTVTLTDAVVGSIFTTDINKDGFDDIVWVDKNNPDLGLCTDPYDSSTCVTGSYNGDLKVKYWNPALNNNNGGFDSTVILRNNETGNYSEYHLRVDNFNPITDYVLHSTYRTKDRVLMDIDSDGDIDLIRRPARHTGNISVVTNLSDVPSGNYIVAINNGLGKEINIRYESLARTDHYKRIEGISSSGITVQHCYTEWVYEDDEWDGNYVEICNEVVTGAAGADDFYEAINDPWDYLGSNAQSLRPTSPVLESIGARQVVVSVSTSAPAAGTVPGNVDANTKVQTSYLYEQSKIQAGGRGSLGFKRFTVVNVESGLHKTVEYRQDWPFVGRPRSEQTLSADNSIISESEYRWGFVDCYDENGIADTNCYIEVAEDLEEEGSSYLGPLQLFQREHISRRYDLVDNGAQQGDLLAETVSTNIYDDLGNAKQTNETTRDFTLNPGGKVVLDKTTANTYQYGGLTWSMQLGRLLTMDVTSDNDDYPAISRRSSFSYYTTGNWIGLINTETIEPDDPDFAVTTTHYYDDFGNKVRSSITADGQSRYQRVEYDARGRYVDKTFDVFNDGAGGQTERLVNQVINRDKFGTPTEVQRNVGVNNIITSISATTAFGTPYFTTDSSGTSTVTTAGVGADTAGVCNAAFTTVYSQSQSADGSEAIVCTDVRGRKIREATRGFDGNWIVADTEYNKLDRIVRASEPHTLFGTAYWTENQLYDVLGRPGLITAPNTATTTFVYSGFTTWITNILNQTRIEQKNVLDQMVQVTDPLNGITSFTYDARGNLRTMTDPALNTTTISFDKLDRKIAMSDPDKGNWVYSYNRFNELVCQLDANGQMTTQSYDVRGRLITRTDYQNDGSNSCSPLTTGGSIESNTTWTYDTAANGLGQLAGVVDNVSNYSQEVYYDRLGRTAQTRTTLPGVDGAPSMHYQKITYDEYGRVFQTFDAARNTDDFTRNGVRHHYQAYGYLEKITDAVSYNGEPQALYYQVDAMDERGNVTLAFYGNGVTQAAEYDPETGLATQLEAYTHFTSNPIQNLALTWDLVGNLTSRAETGTLVAQDTTGTLTTNITRNLVETMPLGSGYDQMNRLRNYTLSGDAAGNFTVDIDNIGNITAKSDVGTYLYGSTCAGSQNAGPHAVCEIQGNGFTYQYSYDDNGNQISGAGRTIDYTVFDKPSRIEKGGHITEFEYGPDRTRYKRIDTGTNGQTTTLYIGGVEKVYYPDGTIQWKRDIGGVGLILQQVDGAGVVVLNENQHYFQKDHLGSIAVITDQAGNVVQAMDFDPWGKRRNIETWNALTDQEKESEYGIDGKPITTRGFTGHEMLDEVGLVHMNGRIYDDTIARFVQADPIIQDPFKTQSLNRYSYVWNNPLNATDPSGFYCDRQEQGDPPCKSQQEEKEELQNTYVPYERVQDGKTTIIFVNSKIVDEFEKRNSELLSKNSADNSAGPNVVFTKEGAEAYTAILNGDASYTLAVESAGGGTSNLKINEKAANITVASLNRIRDKYAKKVSSNTGSSESVPTIDSLQKKWPGFWQIIYPFSEYNDIRRKAEKIVDLMKYCMPECDFNQLNLEIVGLYSEYTEQALGAVGVGEVAMSSSTVSNLARNLNTSKISTVRLPSVNKNQLKILCLLGSLCNTQPTAGSIILSPVDDVVNDLRRVESIRRNIDIENTMRSAITNQ